MAREIDPGDWRILHGKWSGGGESLTIVATRLTPFPPRVSRLSRSLRRMRAMLRRPRIITDETSGVPLHRPRSTRRNISQA